MEPDSTITEAKPPKKKAEDNPWYLLATLYDVPQPKDLKLFEKNRKLFEKNRGVWNHCLASFLAEHERDALIKAERYTKAELEPIFPISWETELREALARRVTNEAQAGELEAWFASANKTIPDIDFSNTEFDRDISFNGYLFSVRVLFKKTKFSEFAGFQNTTFFKPAQFNGASFQAAHFDNAHFWGASFQAATFAKSAVFTKATFSVPGAYFEKTRFRYADFSKANFFTGAYFNDSRMKGKTSFEGVRFLAEPPEFFNAKLHQGTVWRGINWPKPNDTKKAEIFLDAYACLKPEMNRLQKHEDELNFFALELQSRRVLHGDWNKLENLKLPNRTISLPLRVPPWTFVPKLSLFSRNFSAPPLRVPGAAISLYRPAEGLPIAIYERLSDYGRSYIRPLKGLFVTALLPTPAFWLFGPCCILKSLGLSFANTLNVFGFRKDFFSNTISG